MSFDSFAEDYDAALEEELRATGVEKTTLPAVGSFG